MRAVGRNLHALGTVIMSKLVWSIVLLAGLMLPACGSLTTPTAQPLTKYEARNMPEGALKRRVTDLLADQLQRNVIGNETRRPVTVLSDMYFYLKPRATEYRGLCSVTSLTFEFAPESSKDADSSTPTAVRDLYSEQAFRLLSDDDLPTVPFTEMTETEYDRANAACARLDPDHVNNFGAPDTFTAYYGARMFQQVLQDLKDGNPEFAFACREDQEYCGRLIDSMEASRLGDIGACETEIAGMSCLSFSGGLAFEIAYTGNLTEPSVKRVDMLVRVIIADYTID